MKMMMTNTRGLYTRKLVLSAMFCALTFLGTCIAIPVPVAGNLNFGDGFLLVGAWTLGLPWGLGAALGAMLSDLAMGYGIYIPATLVIKALMVTAAVLLRRTLEKTRLPRLWLRLIPFVLAELLMTGGYYLFESVFVLDSFGAALANIPFNLLQGLFALLIATLATFRDWNFPGTDHRERD